jgi:glycosyltransferase involved in cell wall biosynthesis
VGRPGPQASRVIGMSHVLLIRQGLVPYDPRVKRDIDALVGEGYEVDVLCLGTKGQARFERLPGVTIRRLRAFNREAGLRRYFVQYPLFFVAAAAVGSLLHLKRRYAVVQVHSLPDPLVFAALVPKLLGARVILDLQEPCPEFFASKFRVGMNHWLVRFAAVLEQLSIRFADHVLTCTNQMREAYIRRGAPGDKVTTILNSTDPGTFDPLRFPLRARSVDEFRLICHGTVEERYGIDTAIRAVSLLRKEILGLRFYIYGDGSYFPALRALVDNLGLHDRVSFTEGLVPLSQLLRAIAEADAGVVAMKRDEFRDITLCNKMFDYIAMRRPVIMSRTTAVQAYFDDDCFEMFEADSASDLARAIRSLHDSPERCRRLVDRARDVAEPHRWAVQRRLYLNTVRRLVGNRQ